VRGENGHPTNVLGAYVRARREEQGLSQSEVARRSGVPQAYLSEIERGWKRRPSAEMRGKVAEALGIPVVELLIASGDVTRADLEAWVGQRGPSAVADGHRTAAGLVAELEKDSPTSARWRLAEVIAVMTMEEAAFLLDSFERLPSEAAEKRRQLGERSPEYAEWRIATDALESL